LVMGAGGDGAEAAGASNVLNQLVALLLAEKAGLGIAQSDRALAELDAAVHAAAKAAAEAPSPALGSDSGSTEPAPPRMRTDRA